MSNTNRGLFGSRYGEDGNRFSPLGRECGWSSPVSGRECGRSDRDPVDVLVRVEDRDRCDRHDKCCRPIDVALNAATGGAGPLPAIAVGALTQAIPVVSVTIDADCICDPDILLTFSALVSIPVALSAVLNFTVFRTSVDNGTPITVGPAFTFIATVAAVESESFTFQLFDSDLQPGTYTYTVVLAPAGTTTTVAGVTILNATLSVLAVNDAR